MKKYIYLTVLALILGLVLTGCSLLSNISQVPATNQSGITYLTKGGTEAEPVSFPLYAGQDWLVGEVLVWDNGLELCVKYRLFDDSIEDPEDVVGDGWGITETHLAVATSLSGIPTNKSDNPVPGKFPYVDDDLPGVEETEQYCIPFEDIIGFVEGESLCDTDIVIAAHAKIEKVECEVLTEAPYGGLNVTGSMQGLRKDGNDVRSGRSDPNAVLTWDTNKLETDFFSLGFGGEITVEFDCCIANGEGPDVLVVEDTWGTYKLETAEVYASVDNIVWVLLGEANNLIRDTTNNWQTVSEFDLGDLECAKYIKVVDTTDPAPLPDDADGYDLNTILSLQDCVQCTIYDESAWGAVLQGSEQFDGANWATYFNYTTVECCFGCPDIIYNSVNIEVLASPPPDVRVGKYESTEYIRVWKEFEGELQFDLQYDLAKGDIATNGIPSGHPYTISAGTEVCIYYVHFDSVGITGKLQNGSVTFDADILGVIISGGSLGTFAGKNLMFAADTQIGTGTGTTYPATSGNDYLRGYDVNAPGNADNVVFSGDTVNFVTWVSNAHDSLRVILPKILVPCE